MVYKINGLPSGGNEEYKLTSVSLMANMRITNSALRKPDELFHVGPIRLVLPSFDGERISMPASGIIKMDAKHDVEIEVSDKIFIVKKNDGAFVVQIRGNTNARYRLPFNLPVVIGKSSPEAKVFCEVFKNDNYDFAFAMTVLKEDKLLIESLMQNGIVVNRYLKVLPPYGSQTRKRAINENAKYLQQFYKTNEWLEAMKMLEDIAEQANTVPEELKKEMLDSIYFPMLVGLDGRILGSLWEKPKEDNLVFQYVLSIDGKLRCELPNTGLEHMNYLNDVLCTSFYVSRTLSNYSSN
jgi:hypothetical protein